MRDRLESFPQTNHGNT